MAYIRGKFYTFKGKEMYMFGLGDVPEQIVDEFVVMRFARMTKKQIKVAEKRAIRNHWGNFGCDGLCKKYKIPTVMEIVKKEVKKATNKKKKGKNG